MFADALPEDRAGARGLSPEEYLRTGNLLRRQVLAEDVAQAFVALARKTTAATLMVGQYRGEFTVGADAM